MDDVKFLLIFIALFHSELFFLFFVFTHSGSKLNRIDSKLASKIFDLDQELDDTMNLREYVPEIWNTVYLHVVQLTVKSLHGSSDSKERLK